MKDGDFLFGFRRIGRYLVIIAAVLLMAATVCLFSCGEKGCGHVSDGGTVELEAEERVFICTKCGEELKREPLPSPTFGLSAVTERILPSLLTVTAYGEDGEEINRGSGFFIDGIGTFVTNAHVIVDAEAITVTDRLGTAHTVTLILKYDYTSSDYAVCRAEGIASTPLSLAEGPSEGDPIYAAGFPVSTGELTVSVGRIASLDFSAGGKDYLSATAEVSSGCSGGAVLDGSGRAVGIITGIHYTGVTVAVSLETALEGYDPDDKGVAVSDFFASDRVLQ